MSEKKPKTSFRELSEKFGQALGKAADAAVGRGVKLWIGLPYDDKIALAAYLATILYAHLRDGGTYRYLLYERLQLGMDAYSILTWCGLLDVHNALVDAHSKKNESVRAIAMETDKKAASDSQSFMG